MLAAIGLAFLMAGCGVDSRDRHIQYGDPTPAKLVFSDLPRYDFGVRLVGTSTDKSISVTNSGGLAATEVSSSFNNSVHYSYKGGPFPGVGGTCGGQIDSGATCQITVSFAPQYNGHFEQPVGILFFDGINNQRTTGPYLYGDGI